VRNQQSGAKERKSDHALGDTISKASCRPDHFPPCPAATNPSKPRLLNLEKMRSFCIHCCGWGCVFRMAALQGRCLPPLDLVLFAFCFLSNNAHEFVLSPTTVSFASGGSPLRTWCGQVGAALGSCVSMSVVVSLLGRTACPRPTTCCHSCPRSLVQSVDRVAIAYVERRMLNRRAETELQRARIGAEATADRRVVNCRERS
jgi:hypothetical protein